MRVFPWNLRINHPLFIILISFLLELSAHHGGWNYHVGNFTQQALPLSDHAVLTIQRMNHTLPDIIRVSSFIYEQIHIDVHQRLLPYRSRSGPALNNSTDSVSYRAHNCVVVAGTNGGGNPTPLISQWLNTNNSPPSPPKDHRNN